MKKYTKFLNPYNKVSVYNSWKLPIPAGGYSDYGTEYTNSIAVGTEEKPNRYFYHPDHLGSTSYITDNNGEVSQHIEYIPFGETFVSEYKNAGYNSPYRFNGSEFDSNTGLYYMSARYMNPRYSIFLGVDLMSQKYPSFSPYAFALNNPMRFIDPTGMEAENNIEPPIDGLAWFKDDTGEYFWNPSQDKYEHYAYDKYGATYFKGYYSANTFKEPVGDYNIIFDLSNIQPKDIFDENHTITSIATPLTGWLMAKEMEASGGAVTNLKDISNQQKYPGVSIYSSKFMNGALTAGNVIFTNPQQSDIETLAHEYGHYLDFKYHFQFDKQEYLKTIAVPSVISAATSDTREKHHSSPSEKRADILGSAYSNVELYKPKKK